MRVLNMSKTVVACCVLTHGVVVCVDSVSGTSQAPLSVIATATTLRSVCVCACSRSPSRHSSVSSAGMARRGIRIAFLFSFSYFFIFQNPCGVRSIIRPSSLYIRDKTKN